jgi:hypothetical protein
VDDEDFEYLNQFNWSANNHKHTYYAQRNKLENCKHYRIYMHREILGLTDYKIKSDHIDHNGLNNCRSNLRTATHAQNNFNRLSGKNTTSKYQGVSLKKVKHKDKVYTYWRVRIYIGNKQMYIRHFNSEIDAAKQYNEWAKEVHGEFATLNKI